MNKTIPAATSMGDHGGWVAGAEKAVERWEAQGRGGAEARVRRYLGYFIWVLFVFSDNSNTEPGQPLLKIKKKTISKKMLI